MLTKGGYAILNTSLLLIVAGLTFGNYYFLLVASFPLLFFLGAVGIEEPRGISVTRNVPLKPIRAGELLEVSVDVAAESGSGLVEVHCPVPEVFEVTQGSNIHLFHKGYGRLETSFKFTMRCTKRGTWELPPVDVEAVHALGVRAPVQSQAGRQQWLEVKPRLPGLRRVRGLTGYAKRIYPESDEARMGVQTTDFREIRDYQWGDPPSAINWKATARRQSGALQMGGAVAPSLPLVNEYEHEGKKTVWMFVDGASYMEVGSNVENAFEYGLEAAQGVASFYLDHGYRLGCYIYNAQDQLAYPDSGGKQFLKISQMLTHLHPSQPWQTVRMAVERCRGFIVSGRPLVVIVTRVTENTEGLISGIQRVRAFTGRRRRALPVVVVTPAIYRLMPQREEYGQDAAEMLRRLDRPAFARVRALGAAVVEWDPRRHNFATAFMRGAR